MIKPFSYLIKYFWKDSKIYIILTFIINILQVAFQLSTVVLPGLIIAELMNAQRENIVIGYLMMFLLINLFGGIILKRLETVSWNNSMRSFNNFAVRLISKSFDLDMAMIENSDYLDEVEKASRFISNQGWGGYFRDFSLFLGRLLMLFGLAGIIVILDIWISLFFVILLGVNFSFDRKARKKNAEIDLELANNNRRTKYFTIVAGRIELAKEIRLFGLASWLQAKWNDQKEHIYQARKKQYRIRAHVSYFSTIFSFLRNVVTYGYLIYSVLVGTLDIASFTIFLTSILRFSEALKNVLDSFLALEEHAPYFFAFKEWLEVKATMRDNEKLPVPHPIEIIEFKNVSFQYPKTNIYALKNINLTLKATEKLAIVGSNGAGKSTFIKLLCRFYDPTEGEILVNGINIKQLDYEAYITKFGTVFQDFSFFSMPVKENVVFDNDELDENVQLLLEKTGIWKKIGKLKKGIYNDIHKEFNEDGFEPSGGEGQKLALARALYKDAPLLILDEPTASLDAKAELELYEQFSALAQDKLAIFITHRLASTRFCDKIIVFSNDFSKNHSSIIQYGTHDELIAQKGVYQELFTSQASLYKEGDDNE